jgi:hypothetical protein
MFVSFLKKIGGAVETGSPRQQKYFHRQLPKALPPISFACLSKFGDGADDTFDSLPVHLEGVRILPLLSEFVEPTCASALIMRLDQNYVE